MRIVVASIVFFLESVDDGDGVEGEEDVAVAHRAVCFPNEAVSDACLPKQGEEGEMILADVQEVLVG